MLIKRSDLFWTDLIMTRGSEQTGRRPVLVIQNNTGNELAATTIIAPLTTKKFFKEYPTNVSVPKGISGLKSDSTVLLHQIRTIDKARLEKKIGFISEPYMKKVDQAIKISLGLF